MHRCIIKNNNLVALHFTEKIALEWHWYFYTVPWIVIYMTTEESSEIQTSELCSHNFSNKLVVFDGMIVQFTEMIVAKFQLNFILCKIIAWKWVRLEKKERKQDAEKDPCYKNHNTNARSEKSHFLFAFQGGKLPLPLRNCVHLTTNQCINMHTKLTKIRIELTLVTYNRKIDYSAWSLDDRLRHYKFAHASGCYNSVGFCFVSWLVEKFCSLHSRFFKFSNFPTKYFLAYCIKFSYNFTSKPMQKSSLVLYK